MKKNIATSKTENGKKKTEDVYAGSGTNQTLEELILYYLYTFKKVELKPSTFSNYIDVFNYYVGRLATFIIEKNAHVKNHYETILKWNEEDSKVNKKTKKKERHGNFDIEESFENAIKRSYGEGL